MRACVCASRLYIACCVPACRDQFLGHDAALGRGLRHCRLPLEGVGARGFRRGSMRCCVSFEECASVARAGVTRAVPADQARAATELQPWSFCELRVRLRRSAQPDHAHHVGLRRTWRRRRRKRAIAAAGAPGQQREWPSAFVKLNVQVNANCTELRWSHVYSSQRSFQLVPIFRLLLKVAVRGTHQCDFHYF